MTGRPTTQQLRARHAWDTVQSVPTDKWDDFDGHVKRMGPRIITAGLGPAVAFICAKEGSSYVLLQHLASWLLRPEKANLAGTNLQQQLMSGTSDQLRRWTSEALEWLVWVKRFCEAKTTDQETSE
jgi:CRISPR-associated protein Cmr5